MEEKYTLICMEKDREKYATITLTENEDEYVNIGFLLDNLHFEKKGETYFETLIEIRKELELRDIKLFCKGCSKNVYPSGMILSMGTGRRAYELRKGEQAQMNSLVDIFEGCTSEEYATIQEQHDFFQEWIHSLGRQ